MKGRFSSKNYMEITNPIFTSDEADKLTRNATTDEGKAHLLAQLEKVVIGYVGICSMLDDKGLEADINDDKEVIWKLTGQSPTDTPTTQ